MGWFDVIVVGQGYAGLRAARLARERGLSVATFEGVMAGGAVMTVLRLDPSPEPFTGSGPDLAAIISMENMDLGVVTFFDPVVRLHPRPPAGWEVVSARGVYAARHVVLATGARPRRLGIPGEAAFAGQGVSACADCDSPRVAGRDCVVVGGGDAAFQEAAILSGTARSVTILMRGTVPAARPDLVGKALASGRARVLPEHRLVEIGGTEEEGVTGVRIEDAAGARTHLAAAGVFVFIGADPDTTLLPPAIARDSRGALVADGRGALGLPGLWAVGAVRSGYRGGLAGAAEDAARTVAAL